MPELFDRVDLWIVGLYLLAMLAIGWYVSDQSRDVEGFTLGNRSMPGWVLGMSVLGAFLSSITFIALPAKTYTQGNWNALIFGLMPPVAALLAVKWLVPLYRHKTRLSAYELLEQRFGYWARAYAALSFLATQILRIGMVQLLVAYAVSPLIDWQPPEGWNPDDWYRTKVLTLLAVCGGVVIVYDVMGGIRAVVWTDTLQVTVLAFGAVWCLGELMIGAHGSIREFFAHLPAERLDPGPWLNFDAGGAWDWAIPSVLVMAVYGFTENLKNYGADQQYVQRMLCARDDRAAARAILIGAWGYVPMSFTFCLIGTGLWVYYSTGGGHTLPPGVQGDAVFPYFIRNELPLPVTGLIVAAILAAAMSTTDSNMNSSAMIILCDILRRIRSGPPRLPEIVTLRICTVSIGLFGTAMSMCLFLTHDQQAASTLMDRWWQYVGVVGGGMFGLFILAWTMPRLPAWGAGLALAATVPVLAWGTFARKLDADSPWANWECRLHPNLIGVTATLTMIAVAACVLVVRPRRDAYRGLNNE